MRRLQEWIAVEQDNGIEPHAGLAHDNAIAEWSGLPYAELSVVLVHLRYLSMLHQVNHWVAKGDAFYGDHTMFQLLYDRTIQDIDDVAEKAVGLGSEQNVNLDAQLSQLFRLSRSSSASRTVPHSNGLAQASLDAESRFVHVLKGMRESLHAQGAMTDGLDDLLPRIADRHEHHCYLLRRRCMTQTMGL